MASYVDIWPKNPWSTAPMNANSATQGNCMYTGLSSNTTFTLVGYGKGTSNVVISVP